MNLKRYIVVLLVVTGLQPAHAQVELGINAEVNAPLMFVRNVGDYNHSLAAFNSRFTVNYLPQAATFFPSLSLGYSSILVPMAFAGNQAVSVRFATAGIFFSVGRRKHINTGDLDISLGLGMMYMSEKGLDLSGDSSGVQVVSTDNINLWTPSINLGLEYTFPISKEVPLYAGIGAHLQYAWFYDKGRQYGFNVTDPVSGAYNLQGQLYGHMLNPGGSVSLYYRFAAARRY